MTWLYRAYDKDDQLLYIGITELLDRRMRDHWGARWRREVDHWVVREYPDREAAMVAETEAIIAERPPNNRAPYDPVTKTWANDAPASSEYSDLARQ